jgi:RimJ/RimL family protein N-acetyltransferase
MVIRKTTVKDIDIVMHIYEEARQFMRETGNAKQWGNIYPEQTLIEKDIQNDHSYVCLDATGNIIATFYFVIAEEPTYNIIEKGTWLNNEPYGVIHRIAKQKGSKGIASFCIKWCFEQCRTIRIDTHRDNIVMQELLKKLGFKYCGIIHLLNGDERLAFQKTNTE